MTNLDRYRWEDAIWYDIFVNCNWVDIRWAVVQYTFTHKQYTEQHNGLEYPKYSLLKQDSAQFIIFFFLI